LLSHYFRQVQSQYLIMPSHNGTAAEVADRGWVDRGWVADILVVAMGCMAAGDITVDITGDITVVGTDRVAVMVVVGTGMVVATTLGRGLARVLVLPL